MQLFSVQSVLHPCFDKCLLFFRDGEIGNHPGAQRSVFITFQKLESHIYLTCKKYLTEYIGQHS